MYGRPGPRVSHGNGSGTGVPRGSRGVAVVAGLAPAPDATGSAPALAVDGLGDFGGLQGTARGGTPGTGNCNAVGWSRAHGNARWRFWRGAGAGVSLALWLGNHAASPPPRGCEGALCNRSTPISSLPDFLWLNCCCFPLRPFPPRDACSTAGLSSAWIRPCHAGRGTRPPPPPPKSTRTPMGASGASPPSTSCAGVAGCLFGVSFRQFWGCFRVTAREGEAEANPGRRSLHPGRK